MKKLNGYKSLLSAIVFLTAVQAVYAQPLPAIEERTKNWEKKEGLFNMYIDYEMGRLYLEINRFNEEFLYATGLPAGLGSNDVGLDRGKLLDNGIVRFEKVGRKILMMQPNYAYRALTDSEAERKAVQQSFAEGVLWGFTAEAATGNRVLVEATDFLLRDAGGIATTLRRSGQGGFSLDKSRSALYLPATKNFPLNTEMEATLTFVSTDGQPGAYVRSVAANPEAVTVRLHHSLVQLPNGGFTPRILDPRSSFFGVSWFNYSSSVSSPIEEHMAVRHRLQKKNPNAALSEPVKPIVYYVDAGTPEPIRSALVEGASWWNEAFEAAGFKNAFQVKLLPADADPMDVRYNVINWVHRSTRGWSYGASVVDPRTGEIIKGHVTLGSLRVRQDYLIFSALLAPFEKGALPPATDPMLKAALQRLRQLSAHEVGHTLGLMHNYASSVNNRASVMDYPHPWVKLNSKGLPDLSDAYANGIGQWDKVAIAWGYSQIAAGQTEQKVLDGILRDAAARGLQFIADRDARAPGGLHPQAHLWDNGADAVKELEAVMEVRKAALSHFGQHVITPGTPWAMLEDALVPVYYYHRYQAEAVAKWVGGMQYTYALRGDGQTPTQPLPAAQQERALQALLATLQPQHLILPDELISLIPPRPPMYNFTRELFKKRTGLAFDALSPAEAAADMVWRLLLHPERLSRLAIQEAKGQFGLSQMLEICGNTQWKNETPAGMAGLIVQQNRQVMLTHVLAALQNPELSFAAKAGLQTFTDGLQNWCQQQAALHPQNGYWALALKRLKKPEMAKPADVKEAPPGAPIGCEAAF